MKHLLKSYDCFFFFSNGWLITDHKVCFQLMFVNVYYHCIVFATWLLRSRILITSLVQLNRIHIVDITEDVFVQAFPPGKSEEDLLVK